jgi:mRNA-degrading endonuclease RelE of RelBE toxin-antitoxin system
MYRVMVKKAAIKRIGKAPESIRLLFGELMADLAEKGPIQSTWARIFLHSVKIKVPMSPLPSHGWQVGITRVIHS